VAEVEMDESLRVTTDSNYGGRLKPIKTASDIPKRWLNTPIEQLIKAHNFDVPIEPATEPQLMVVTCIEFRFQPKVPHFFAYELRQASGRLMGSEFTLAYVLTKGVKHLALIGHNDCGMTKVKQAATALERALVGQGWPAERAHEYVTISGPRYAIRDELDALEKEFHRLRRLFKNLEIAPLFAALANSNLYLPTWYDPNKMDSKNSQEVAEQDLLML
jgi:carbonic anhydrase